MSSYYDGQPRPPKAPPLTQQAKAAADRYVPLFYDPRYEEPPASKRPEILVFGVLIILGVLVFTWAMSVFNGGSEERAIAAGDIAVRQEWQDEQAYDDIRLRPYTMPNADWNLDGVVDPADLTYFDEVINSATLPYDAVLSLAQEVADSTYPEVAAGRVDL